MNKFWTAIIVIAVILGGVWWAKGGSLNTVLMNSGVTSSTAQPSISNAPSVKVVKKTAAPTPTPTPALTYTQLVQKYGSNRIQFDRNCQAQPKSLVYKNGTTVLLDNRANQVRTIGINGVVYTLSAYGYQEVTLSDPTTPKAIGISCNNLVNVGTIQLQANISGQ